MPRTLSGIQAASMASPRQLRSPIYDAKALRQALIGAHRPEVRRPAACRSYVQHAGVN
ncbi:hypothetical protein I552_4035 [Mycobacterium xenopi 3993]|nr:hypothetical protein I552_4035 [Mycobacterium xenopi 3993]